MTATIRSTDGLSATDLEAQRQHYQSTPPSHLSEFRTKPADLSSHGFDGHGEELNSYWAIACHCGSEDFSITAYSVINKDWSTTEPIVVSPITVTCDRCSNEGTVFDSKMHGYDPVACGDSFTIYGPDTTGATTFVHSCPTCQATSHRVVLRFEYPGDLFDDEMEDCRGREADLFTWFTLVTECSRCKAQVEFADFECA